MSYLKVIFSYLFSNLNRQVAAIATDGFSSLYLFLIFFSRIICIVRWFIRTLAMFIDLSFIFKFDILSKRKPVEEGFLNLVLTFIHTVYYLFFLRFTILLYLNSTDKLVWSHLYDMVVRNREQVKLHWWGVRSFRQWWSAPTNHIAIQRVPHQGVTSWFSQLKCFIIFSRLKIHRSAKLLFYPHLEEKLRIKCLLVCYLFEALMVLIYAYYLVLLLYFDLKGSIKKLLHEQANIVQWASVPIVYLVNLQTAYYTYSSVLLVELLLYLVCHIYIDQYRIVNSDLEMVKTAMFKTGNPSSLLASLNRFTSAYRTAHSRLTVFILRLNSCLISKVIAYYLHYYLPYHSNRMVSIHFDKYTLAVTFNSYWFMVFMGLFLLFITFLVARVNGEISRSGRLLSAIFARRSLLAEVNSVSNAESFSVIGHREALKLSSYFELVWREEKQLAFTTGQSNTAMSWRFIYEVLKNGENKIYFFLIF